MFVKTIAVAGAGIVLVSAIAISIVFFAVAIVFLVGVGGYLWWKTRHLRKQMRTQFAQSDVIEGVVIREDRIEQISDPRRDAHRDD